MVTQLLSISSIHHTSTEVNQSLALEIGNNHIALITKAGSVVNAFELYETDITKSNWQSIFSAVKNYSKILTKNYAQTIVYINIAEALLVPAVKFTKDSIEPYLTVMFGNNHNCVYLSETVQMPTLPTCAYRIPNSLNETTASQFSAFIYKHTYTKLLEKLLGSDSMIMEIIKVQFYPKHMIVAVVSNNKLQLIQSYNYSSAEDVIYYLLNIVQEFGLNVKNTPVEVSGMIDIKGKHFELLENVFGRLSLETLTAQGIFTDVLQVANAHYYTPFYNLAL